MGTEEFIAIPHFINPQLFWYHKVDGQNPEFIHLQRIEESIQTLFTAKQGSALRPYRPLVGEIVAVAFVSWNKYIRARVEHIVKYSKLDDEYIVWALDYGFPFQTKLCYVRKLPDSYTDLTDYIRLGAIANVVPAELDFDFVTTTSRLVCKQSWSQRAVELLERVTNDAASVSFIELFSVDRAKQTQHFGDLKIINHSGDEFLVSDYLIKMNYAVKCVDNFREKLANLQTDKIPCWETNANDVKIIENKLNTLNMNYAQGKFDFSGSLSESSCDTFSKQKVMDWCERNQNLTNENVPNTDALCPSSALDATDISFDDSVSVKNYKPRGTAISTDESLMGYAGALHASRRKKYEGKGLPPKPAVEVFQVIPEKKLQNDKDEDLSKSGGSETSAPSRRAIALIELRKNHQELMKEKQKKETPHEERDRMRISTGSEVAAVEFLETCKKRNASARLEKLKELRRRRAEDNNSSANEGNNSATQNVEENCGSSSTTSSRQLRLKQIREKHSKQAVRQPEQVNDPTDVSILDDKSQTESEISAHAAKLISLRKKIKDKYSQFPQQEEVAPIVQSHKTKGYKMPQHSQKFNKLEFLNASEDYVDRPVEKPRQEQLPPASTNDIKTEEEKQKFREIIQANPFHSMTMVPAGFDVTKLVKRHDEETHWHTKKTTLNDSFPSNHSADGSNNNAVFGEKRSVARRTEDVEQQNFRLTRSRKERNRPGTDDSSDNKHLLDLSLNDSDCAPAITPVVVPVKPGKVPSGDFLLFNDIHDPAVTDKLIDLSGPMEPERGMNVSGTASSDSFLKFVKEKSYIKDTSREQLLDSGSSSDTADDSFHSLSVDGSAKALIEKELQEMTVKIKSSSSVSSSSSTKLDSGTHKSKEFTKGCKDQDRSYEASSSSRSSGCEPKVEVVGQVAIQRPNLESSSSSSSVVLNEKQFLVLSDEQPLIKSLGTIGRLPSVKAQSEKFPISSGKTPSLSSSSMTSTAQPTENSSSKFMQQNRPPSPSSLKSPTPIFLEETSSKHLPQNPKHLPETPKHLPVLLNEASLKTNFIQHLVLAHCKVKVTPIERMTSALFSPEIHREMELMRLTKMYRIQSYSWAHLVRGNSFFVINGARSGKTWCYLPPLCSMVGYRLETNCLPNTYGPVAVIIAPSSVQVESITRHCRRLLASTKTRVTIVPSYAYRNTEEVKIELHNGCGILIITPSSLQRLLVYNETESLLNMKRIQYVVVDDLDTMTSQDDQFNETLFKFIGPALQQQENGKVPFQMVVTTKRWSRRITNLLRISNQPLLCIADYLEAAVYAKNKISIKLQSSADKMLIMVKCLEKCPYTIERVLVICSTDDEVEMVHKSLIEAGYACLAYSSRMTVEYSNLVNEWKLKTICHQILVTTDGVLPELMIQNVWTLIHYSLPKSWTKFNFRFSTFLQNYENLLVTDFRKPAKVPKSVVLIDEENNLQLPRLIEFMKNHSQLKYIPKDILNVAANVRADREELRVSQGIQMCPKVLEFGTCDQSSKCAHRHQLTKYDGPVEGLPTHGEVRLKILDVLSPIHYTARILSHKNGNQWDIVRRSNEVTYFLMQLSLHFMNENSLVIHWPPKVNDLCVYKGEDIFHRCRVLEFPPIVNEHIVKLVNVKVKLIDSGAYVMCKSHDLLVIPDKFKDFPAQAIDIRLAGIVPFDSERAWDSRSRRAVKKWIMTDVTDKDCLHANINFVLMDTVWVDNVILMELLKTVRGYVIKTNVRRSLLLKNFALADDATHLVKQTAAEIGLLQIAKTEEPVEGEQNLLEFSTSTDAELSHTELPHVNSEPESVKQIVPNSAKKAVSKRAAEEWMQLRRDELLQVRVTQFHDPAKFYLRFLNKEEELSDLEDMIRGHKRVQLQDPHPMQNCLASLNGRYCRAKIQRLIIDSTEGFVQARVFFCDHGLFANYPLEQIYTTSNDIIEYIPFQAICCKLIGIHVDAVGEQIQNFIQIENSVHLAYTIKELSVADDYEAGLLIHHYEIILYQCFAEKCDIQINKMLVDRGLASYDDNTKHFLELETNVDFAEFDFEEDKANNSFDFQSFLDRIKEQMDEDNAEELNMSASKSNGIAAIENEEPKIVEISPDSTSLEVTRESPEAQLPPLRVLHKRPPTTWYETMCMIYLVIHAPDISDYHLEVTPKQLIFVATVNGEEHMLKLDFLGYVEPDQTTHEIRGLNVVVRLVKNVYMKWPRLLQDATKASWLTYNFNAIDASEVERLIEGEPISRRRVRAVSYSSSETSDLNAAETFTPIVNVDQLHDPMQEDFY